MQGTRRVLFGVTLAFALSTPFPSCVALPTTGRSNAGAPEEFIHYDRREEHILTRKPKKSPAARGRTESVGVHKDEKSDREVPETRLIKAIHTPFKQSQGQWMRTGISLSLLAEPKSGSSWSTRVLVELCVQLCGNPENTWCKMGGLRVDLTGIPAPHYNFEMLHADTGKLYMHFNAFPKHSIPLVGERGCRGDMRVHQGSFGNPYPCKSGSNLSREGLMKCLPALTPSCAQHLSHLDPSRRRIAVVFRDARNLIVSEHRMRIKVYHEDVAQLEPFILSRFETVLAWIHQRYVWHTTAMKAVSHVMFYEDVQAHPRHLADLAGFLGLICTPENAENVFRMHTFANPPGDYTTYGLSTQTLEWMNTTMSKTLPEPMLIQYGLPPI